LSWEVVGQDQTTVICSVCTDNPKIHTHTHTHTERRTMLQQIRPSSQQWLYWKNKGAH
jgi:hypothetical protein